MGIALVTGQVAATRDSAATLALPGAVTAGNSVLVACITYAASSPSLTVSKSSGSATVGTVVKDREYANANFSVALFRMPVTGSGTLVVGFTGNQYWAAAVGEYSGMHATPVVDAPVSNSGTGSVQSTGNIVTSTDGMVFAALAEDSVTSFSRGSISDTVLYTSDDNNYVTGLFQYKITGSAGTYALTDTTSNSFNWMAIAVAYKAASGGGGSTFDQSVAGSFPAPAGVATRQAFKVLAASFPVPGGVIAKRSNRGLSGVLPAPSGLASNNGSFGEALTGSFPAPSGSMRKQAGKMLAGTAPAPGGGVVKQTARVLSGNMPAASGDAGHGAAFHLPVSGVMGTITGAITTVLNPVAAAAKRLFTIIGAGLKKIIGG